MIYEVAIVITTAMVFATVFLAVYAVSNKAVQELSPPDEKAKARATQEMKRPYFWVVLTRRTSAFVPERMNKDLGRQIVMAGGLQGMTPAEVMLYVLIATVVGLGFGVLFVALTGWSPLWTVVTTVLGLVLPFMWLRDQVKQRHLAIMRDMPFHLDLLTLSVEAGLDFGAAVARMVDKGKPGALREEFSSFLGEIRMGKTRAESLEAMGQRVGLPALSSFVAALIQADKLGSGLGRTLRLQAEQLRTERFQRAEKLASEAPVKMLLPLVLFIFPTIWIILAAPLVFEWIFKGAP
jgi:tight adherence protein C